MIGWLFRGLRSRRLTTRYPRRPEPATRGYRGRAVRAQTRLSADQAEALARTCLPGALQAEADGGLRLDGARCIGCGLCVDALGTGALQMESRQELAVRDRWGLLADGEAGDGPVPGVGDTADAVDLPRAFRRSIHIRHVDAGSDGAVEQEIAALLNPYYDMQRLGLFFTATPRHADVLLVTGPVTVAMQDYLRRTYEAMPEPRVVIAAGTDACSGGIWSGPEVRGGVDRVLAVDVYIPGDPPPPIALLHGVLLATGRAVAAPPPRLIEASR